MSRWVHLRKSKTSGNNLDVRDVQIGAHIKSHLHSNIGYKDFDSLRTSPNYKQQLKIMGFHDDTSNSSTHTLCNILCNRPNEHDSILEKATHMNPITCPRYYIR